MPRISPGLGDTAQILEPREIKKLAARISVMKRRFPQVSLYVIVRDLPREQPFNLYLFWIFNQSNLSKEAHKLGENRDILLLLDRSQTRMGMIVGYGLEPFFREEALDHLLQLSQPAFREHRWLDGFLLLVEGLDRLLESAAFDLQEALGIQTQMNVAVRSGEY